MKVSTTSLSASPVSASPVSASPVALDKRVRTAKGKKDTANQINIYTMRRRQRARFLYHVGLRGAHHMRRGHDCRA